MDQPISAQDFWLDHLGQAHRFNDWVFSQFRDRLGHDVLEIGCGTGNFTQLIAAAGHRVTGCDIDDAYVAQAAQRLRPYPEARVMRKDATQAEFGQSFDSVVLLDVLEHIEDDVGMLRRLRGALRPGGTLILKVPAMPFLLCGMDRAIGHYRRYSKRSLAARLREAGFVMVRQRHFNAAAVAGWFINGKLLGRVTPPAGQLAAFERLLPVLRFLETLLRPPFGISLITTAVAASD